MYIQQQTLDSTNLDAYSGVDFTPLASYQLIDKFPYILHHINQVQNIHQKKILLEVNYLQIDYGPKYTLSEQMVKKKEYAQF